MNDDNFFGINSGELSVWRIQNIEILFLFASNDTLSYVSAVVKTQESPPA